MSNNNLGIALSAAVPLHILRLKEKGGPDAADFQKASKFSSALGERGDILLFGGGKKGECADLFNSVAFGIAVLAFCPGGIDLFGQHWETKK